MNERAVDCGRRMLSSWFILGGINDSQRGREGERWIGGRKSHGNNNEEASSRCEGAID